MIRKPIRKRSWKRHWCYDPLADIAVNELPAMARGQVTFGCLNNFRKVSSAALMLWAQVLRSVPQSRLRLVASLGKARARVRHVFEQAGIDAERIQFVGYAPRELYLQEYQQIDCCLDTLPYNGGTTSLDALWMGVPVITLVGTMVTGRSGKALAHNLEMPELVSTSPDEYVARAVDFVSDLRRLAEIRRGLRSRLESSPLMNPARFARNLEQAYREMWQRWCDAPSG
jgi:predicted O-linked N-acetylglucosamine transferase (SPINDLY family)